MAEKKKDRLKKVAETKLEAKTGVVEKEVADDKSVQDEKITPEKTVQDKTIRSVRQAQDKPNASTKQRIRIRLKAYDHKVIDQSAKQIVDNALRTGATIAGPIPLPTRRNTFTVVKSPHVYKKGREQFEMRIHKRLIDVLEPTPKTIDGLMNLSLPAGCDAEIKM